MLSTKKRRFNEYEKQYIMNRNKTDVNYRSIVYTRNRIYKALKGMTQKSSSSDILGIDIETYRKWIEYQMTPGMNWSNIENDHLKAICLFHASKDEELREAFSWKNTQP